MPEPQATPVQQVPVTPFFGGFVLETLTVGMYGESRNAIREYLQNSFDSIQRAAGKSKILDPADGRVEIVMGHDHNSLVIRDNGAGLESRRAVTTLTSVGASTKDYTSDAGFRGIGRLAGIVFSDRVTFTTKARGEAVATTVVFDGALMRKMIAPEQGSAQSADEVLRACVSAQVVPAADADAHYFEVRLEGFVDPPEECTSFHALRDFVAQVAPVPYGDAFPFRAKLTAAASKHELPIEEVGVTIQDGAADPVAVTKLYGATYAVDGKQVRLTDCEIRSADDGGWWAWYGVKEESGAYDDERVRGLRMRVKNIQIDGTDLVRDVFARRAKSHARFQEWFVGEVFVRPSFLVPNARRDGFEENKNWKRMRADLGRVAKELGDRAYDVSNKGQLTLPALERKLDDARGEFETFRRSEFRNRDRVLAVAADVTKQLQRVAVASRDASPATLAKLRAVGSEFEDLRAEALTKITPPPTVDVERLEQDARDAALWDLLQVVEAELGPPCAVAVRNLVREHYALYADPRAARATTPAARDAVPKAPPGDVPTE